MIGVNTLSVLEKPWLRIFLAAIGNILIPVLFLASFVDPQILCNWLLNSSPESKLLISVGAIAYLVVWYLSILPYLSDSPWSHEIGDSNAKRFSELFFLARHFDEYSEHRYGMNANIYWPRLFLILPAGTKESLVQARSNYLTAGLLTCTCLWWFKYSSPVLCGILVYTAICSPAERLLCSIATAILILLYVNNEYFNVLLSFALRRFRVFVALILLFSDRVALLKLLFFVILAAISYQALNAHLLGYQWQDWAICWTPINLGWIKITPLTLEVAALFFLTQTLSRWFVTAGITYGELTCAIFDLHRKELANSLGLKLSDDSMNEHHQWKTHAVFLKDGSILNASRVCSPPVHQSGKNVFSQVYDDFTDDWNKVQDLLKKSSDLSDTPLTRLRKSANETLAGISLVFFCFAFQWTACTLFAFHMPLMGLADSKSPIVFQLCLMMTLSTILPFSLLLVAIAAVICTLHYYIFKKKSPPVWMKELFDDPSNQKNLPIVIGIALVSYFVMKSRNVLPIICSVSLYWILFSLISSSIPELITFRSPIAIPAAALLVTGSNMLLIRSLIYLTRRISRVWKRHFKSNKSEKQPENKTHTKSQENESTLQLTLEQEPSSEVVNSETVCQVQEQSDFALRS